MLADSQRDTRFAPGPAKGARVQAVDWVMVLDVLGILAFAAGGAFSALRATRLDVTGVVTLGLISALGGGLIRDVLIGDVPPQALTTWYYPVAALAGSLLPFLIPDPSHVLKRTIALIDAAGLSLFAVAGAQKTLVFGLGAGVAIAMGGITAVGGGILRDLMVRKVPVVLRRDFYLIPALVGASVLVIAAEFGHQSPLMTLIAGATTFALRAAGMRWKIQAPTFGSTE